MNHYNLALLGFGNVGQALARLLLEKQALLNSQYDLGFSITGIATQSHGMAISHNGLDVEQALNLVQSGQSLDLINSLPIPPGSRSFIQNCQAHVLIENTPVNYHTGQPAVDHLRMALEMGMHAITANKGPVVHAYRELTELAKDKGVKFYFESAVMDGAPIFSLYRTCLPAAELRSLRGILNSTTNLILTRMETGDTFEQAVAFAQSIGIAETDPSGDIDGWDAAVKVAALVTVMMDIPLKPNQVDRQGIRLITSHDLERAKAEGKRWKLVCSARRVGNSSSASHAWHTSAMLDMPSVEARVAPEMVGRDSPLYGVDGTSSVVQFETDVLGLLSVIENDPGPRTTAYGLLADFINATREIV